MHGAVQVMLPPAVVWYVRQIGEPPGFWAAPWRPRATHMPRRPFLFLALCAQVGPLSGLSAHFGVVQDLIFFDEEALGLMAPLNMDPKVSANRPSRQPQPPPLLTPAFIACAYVVPSGRLWHSIFSRAKYYI